MQNRKIIFNLSQKLFCFIILASVLSGAFSVAAQTRRNNSPQVAANQSKQTAQKCTGAWTGVITYTRTQTNTDNKTVPRVSGRGEDKRDWQMKYDYKATVAVVESPERNGSNIGKARVNHTLSSTEKISSKEKNSCDRGKTWQEMTGESTTKTEVTGNASRVEANFIVGVNTDGTYAVSVAISPIRGLASGSMNSTYSGQCSPKEGKNLTMPQTETQIDGNSLTSDGTHRINPNDPNRLSGTYTKTWQNVTETITWNLEKCGAPLRLVDLKFEHPKYPNFEDWKEIDDIGGTIDGNLVKIKAQVLNASGEAKFAEISFKETFKGDKWDGARPDSPFKDGTISARLDAGEVREVEIVWDSSGYSWFDDGRPRLLQRIKAELYENSKKADELTKNLKIAPKPLVLVHGFWDSPAIWSAYQNYLTTLHSFDWKAFPVGEKPEKGQMKMGRRFSAEPSYTMTQNAVELDKYIKYAREDRNAWHVDVIGHSSGGLVARRYIHSLMPESPDGRPVVSHFLMLGTPNAGTACADLFSSAIGIFGNKVEALRELQISEVRKFNHLVKNRRGVKFSALAGNSVPATCGQQKITPGSTVIELEWGDGVISIDSAKAGVQDSVETKSSSSDLVGAADFSNFVKPRVVIGPKGDHNPAPPDALQNLNQINRNPNYDFAPMFTNASFKKGEASKNFAQEVKIAPNQSIEVEIPIAAAPNFGLIFLAEPDVSATLFDAQGAIVGKNLKGTAESKNLFRSIFVNKAVTDGKLKLKLENTAAAENIVLLVVWSGTNSNRQLSATE